MELPEMLLLCNKDVNRLGIEDSELLQLNDNEDDPEGGAVLAGGDDTLAVGADDPDSPTEDVEEGVLAMPLTVKDGELDDTREELESVAVSNAASVRVRVAEAVWEDAGEAVGEAVGAPSPLMR